MIGRDEAARLLKEGKAIDFCLAVDTGFSTMTGPWRRWKLSAIPPFKAGEPDPYRFRIHPDARKGASI